MTYEEIARWGSFIECLELILKESLKRGLTLDQSFGKINNNKIVEYIDSKSEYYIQRIIKEESGFFVDFPLTSNL